MSELERKVRKFLGKPPYDDMTNFVRGDGYFYQSMIDRFGEKEVKEEIKRLRDE